MDLNPGRMKMNSWEKHPQLHLSTNLYLVRVSLGTPFKVWVTAHGWRTAFGYKSCCPRSLCFMYTYIQKGNLPGIPTLLFPNYYKVYFWNAHTVSCQRACKCPWRKLGCVLFFICLDLSKTWSMTLPLLSQLFLIFFPDPENLIEALFYWTDNCNENSFLATFAFCSR